MAPTTPIWGPLRMARVDHLANFLVAYFEYLDGKRRYEDLPLPYPSNMAARPTAVRSGNASDIPQMRTIPRPTGTTRRLWTSLFGRIGRKP